jgi:hypothetical protein
MAGIPPYIFWPCAIAAFVLLLYGAKWLMAWLSSWREQRRRTRAYRQTFGPRMSRAWEERMKGKWQPFHKSRRPR